MNLIRKEETASQVLAVITALFERPGPEEIADILDLARQQAKTLVPVPALAPVAADVPAPQAA